MGSNANFLETQILSESFKLYQRKMMRMQDHKCQTTSAEEATEPHGLLSEDATHYHNNGQ